MERDHTPASPTVRATASGTSYDETPYPSSAFAQTHPDKLGALGWLFGLEATELRQARVLELGCADGANLLPMAQHTPTARFLGIDASAKQVAAAHATIAAVGLTNVEIRHQDILEFPADSGTFDYIIVHGIFSWVPDPVRDKIVRICREHLAPNGIAYISYNAFPGWGMRMALRDMMLFHTGGFADPKMKVQQARALTAFLSDSVPTENNPYGLLLKQELDRMKGYDDNYMRHDILEEVNLPFYFHQFMARAAATDLQYLSETSLDQMLASNFSPKVVETLDKVGGSIVAKEQYMDFVRNRNFRQTLLCHKEVALRRAIMPEAMKRFHFTSQIAKPDPAQFTPAHGVPYGFKMRTGNAVLTSDHSVMKAAFGTLADYRLERISFADLLRIAREKSAPFNNPPTPERAAEEEALLARNLLQLYSRGLVDIFSTPIPIRRQPPERPEATALARHQAMHARMTTSHAHLPVNLDILGRYLLAACDGTRDQAGLVDELNHAVKAGNLRLAENQQPITDETRIRQVLEVKTKEYLRVLADNALFQSPVTVGVARDTSAAAVHAEATPAAVPEAERGPAAVA